MRAWWGVRRWPPLSWFAVVKAEEHASSFETRRELQGDLRILVAGELACVLEGSCMEGLTNAVAILT